MSDCEHTMIGADLDEREPRRNCLPGMRPPAIPVEHQPVDGEDTEWSISIPPMPVPREMRDTVAPKRGLAGDSSTRKGAPVYSGFMSYFPNAIAEVSAFSKYGNDKHNPGEELHWSFSKSTDHGDCIARHQLQAEEIDPDSGYLHAVAVAWRAMAQLESLLLKRHPELQPGKNVRGFIR